MIPYRPPLPPEPQRWMFDTAEQFMKAKADWVDTRRRRQEASKTELAFMITCALVMAAMGVFMIGFVLTIGYGWRGPVGGLLFGGLFWVAVMQIRRWL